jgi:HEAT repeat protein
MNQTKKWIRWLTSNDESERKLATLALGSLNCSSDVDIPSLIEALESENDEIIFWCVGALGSLGERSINAVERIIKFTESNNLGVQQASIYALSRIDKNSTKLNDVFVGKLSDSSEFVVCDALSALTRMNTVGPAEIEAIKLCLTSKSKHVAFQAEVALRNIMLNSGDA